MRVVDDDVEASECFDALGYDPRRVVGYGDIVQYGDPLEVGQGPGSGDTRCLVPALGAKFLFSLRFMRRRHMRLRHEFRQCNARQNHQRP